MKNNLGFIRAHFTISPTKVSVNIIYSNFSVSAIIFV